MAHVLRDVAESDLDAFYEHQREPEATEMAHFPARDREAFVSQSSLAPGVKVLALARAKGLPYVGLDAETVYRHDYPLTRTYNLVTRVPGVKLGQGFITFALSEPGQRLVRDGHRVPASVPVRFTRRLPTASSH